MPRAAGAAAARKRGPKAHQLPETFPPGEVLLQPLAKKRWQLGDVIGQGGFGLIYKASDVTDGPASADPPYVIKIEPLANGPLFCEIHFYQRCAKPENIVEWTKVKKLKYLAVPQFLGTGQHKKGDKQYRYLVMQRFSTDLQKIFEQNGRSFSQKTAFSVGLRMLDALEFIHDAGYCHADIKAGNILLGYNNGKQNTNQVYLVDYGLAYRYLVDGAHKPYKEDPKRAHDGTAEYASRDAHKGVYPSRRGDLEILGYCMLEWLAGSLPWNKDLNNKDRVRDLKIQYMNDLPALLKACFGSKPCPEGLKKYLGVVSKLAYDEKPDYNQLRQFLRSAAPNEWSLGLSDTAPPTKGVKRKSQGEDLPPAVKVARKRPSSSPAPSRKPAATKGSKTKASKSKPLLSNGSSLSSPSPPKRKKTVPPSETPSAGAKKIPGAAKVRGPQATVRSPAAKLAARSPSAAVAKVKSVTTKKAAPMKRKRNKNVTSSDSAVQTSPGFGLK